MSDETQYSSNGSLDEVVFQNRNKEYGAYDLRHSYPKILTKSFVVGTVFFLVTTLSPFIYMKIQQMNAADAVEVDSQLINILPEEEILELPKDEPPPPPPPPPVEPPKIEIIQNVVPEPKVAPKIETPPPPISKTVESKAGLEPQEGIKTPAYTPPPPPPSTGKTATVEVKPKVSETEIYDSVDQTSEFPGGISAFRQKVGGNFDTTVMDGDEGTVKTEVTFVVERDGSITDIKTNGSNSTFNNEAVRTVKGIKNKWTPAKINGTPVRSRYRLPLVMKFEY